MSQPWTEFECPICGADEDIEPAARTGAVHRATCCGREFKIDAENAHTCVPQPNGIHWFAGGLPDEVGLPD